ncbi:MAG: type II secretion system F family protein [Verrucomicrobiia bacterium]
MSSYCYEAVDAGGLKSQGTLDVTDQSEALKRIKEMGLFPTKVVPTMPFQRRSRATAVPRTFKSPIRMPRGRIKPAILTVFTRQLATLIDVGMPLLRGLRILEEQAENQALKRVIMEVAINVESGGTLSEALAAHPRVFSPLYVNLVKAGEIGGVLDVVLRRQAEFMEKALKIKGKIKAAMFYPAAVLVTATGILTLLLSFVIPRFQAVFEGLLNGREMPAFTLLVLKISDGFKSHFPAAGMTVLALVVAFRLFVRTPCGRRWFDRLKLSLPVLGKVFRKVALARFARTFGTLLGGGVPILQALTIVKETAGNVIVGDVIAKVHDNVKEGGSIAGPLKASRIFPAMIAGMVDVGEQTGALPDLLMRIADTCDEEVDNAVSATTALLEPIMIILLAVVVGSIVIAMFLPLIRIIGDGIGGGGDAGGGV